MRNSGFRGKTYASAAAVGTVLAMVGLAGGFGEIFEPRRTSLSLPAVRDSGISSIVRPTSPRFGRGRVPEGRLGRIPGDSSGRSGEIRHIVSTDARKRKFRSLDIVQDWSAYDPYMLSKIDEDLDDDDEEITEEDVMLLIEGFHPSVTPEEAAEYREKEAKKEAARLQAELAKRPTPRPKKYEGMDADGLRLQKKIIQMGPLSDYIDPYDLQLSNLTRGIKLGMDIKKIPAISKDPWEKARYLESQIDRNSTVEEPHTGYHWPYKRNVILTSKVQYNGRPMIEEYSPGRLIACTPLKLNAADLKEMGKAGEHLYDQMAVYVDYQGARDYFVKEGAMNIPQGVESLMVPEKDEGIKTLVQKAASFYFRGWPQRLNPFPPAVKTEFTPQEEAYGKLFINGKFSKTLVVKFGAPHGIKRMMDFFERRRAQCSIEKPENGKASDAYRFELMMQDWQEIVLDQESLAPKDHYGEMVFEFDSENRPFLFFQIGQRFLTLPLEDKMGAFQSAEPNAFRAADLLLGAFLESKSSGAPYPHVKNIFIEAAKNLFLRPDREFHIKKEIKALRNMVNWDMEELTKEDFDLELVWRTDLAFSKQVNETFHQRNSDLQNRLDKAIFYAKEKSRLSLEEDRRLSAAWVPSTFVQEEDPEVVAARLEAEKDKIKNPMPMPLSVDGGLTYQFYPGEKGDPEDIEFMFEMKDQKWKREELFSQFDKDIYPRRDASRMEKILFDRVNETISTKEHDLEKQGLMYVTEFYPKRPEDPLTAEWNDHQNLVSDALDGDIDSGASLTPVRGSDPSGPGPLGDDFPAMSLPAPGQKTPDMSALLSMAATVTKTKTRTYFRGPAMPKELMNDFPDMGAAPAGMGMGKPAGMGMELPPGMGGNLPPGMGGGNMADDFPSMDHPIKQPNPKKPPSLPPPSPPAQSPFATVPITQPKEKQPNPTRMPERPKPAWYDSGNDNGPSPPGLG